MGGRLDVAGPPPRSATTADIGDRWSLKPEQPVTDLAKFVRRPIRLGETRAWRVYTGGKLLEAFRGHDDPSDSHYPEDWVGSTTEARNPDPVPNEGLTLVEGTDGGTVPLRDLCAAYPEPMLGPAAASAGGRLPFLAKLLDSAVRLPIQCHPTREDARRVFGSAVGKTESWIILETRVIGGVEPFVLLGFNGTATEARWREAVLALDTPALESMLIRHAVKPGEVYHVAPGVPHAIGSGVFMVEVQEPSDITVSAENRCADFELTESHRFCGARPEEALSVFDYGHRPPDSHRVAPRCVCSGPGSQLEMLIGPDQTPYYRAWRARCRDRICVPSPGGAMVALVTQGAGAFVGRDWRLEVRRGDTVFFPYASAPRELETGGEAEAIFAVA